MQNTHQSAATVQFAFFALLSVLPTVSSAQTKITFAPPVQYNLPQPSGLACLVAADFNGDGRPDIAVCASGGVGVFMNKGDGTFNSPLVYGVSTGAVGSVFYSAALAAIDINMDGRPDLVALSSGAVNVAINNGNGTFKAFQAYTLPGRGTSLVAGDFNGDGRIDVAVSYVVGNVIYFNNGDGTLTRGATFTAPGFPGGCCGQAVFTAAGDLNGDGVDDLVISEFDNGFAILFGQRTGIMTGILEVGSIPTLSYPYFQLSDMDGDGKPDIISGDQYELFFTMRNSGGVFVTPPTLTYPGNFGGNFGLAVGDFNKDGSNDVFLVLGNQTYAFANNGNGTFGSPAIAASPLAYVFNPFVVADFDGDGLLDAAAFDGASTLSIFRNTTVPPTATTVISGIFPNNGGNVGIVSGLNIIGNGFPPNVQVALVGPGGTIAPASIAVATSGTLITCSFNLVGVTPGSYTLILSTPNGAVIATAPAAFTVSQGGAPSISVDIVGLSVLKGGLAETFYAICTNTGNIDADFATAWISFPGYIDWASGVPGASITSETIGQTTLLGIDFVSIPPGGTQVFPVVLTAPTAFTYAHQPITIQVWTAR